MEAQNQRRAAPSRRPSGRGRSYGPLTDERGKSRNAAERQRAFREQKILKYEDIVDLSRPHPAEGDERYVRMRPNPGRLTSGKSPVKNSGSRRYQRQPSGAVPTDPGRRSGRRAPAYEAPDSSPRMRRPVDRELYTVNRRAQLKERKMNQKLRRRKKGVFLIRLMALALSAAALAAIFFGVKYIRKAVLTASRQDSLSETVKEIFYNNRDHENLVPKPVITEDFIPPNEFSRPQEALPKVKSLFIHYTANPGTTAAQNRSYFETLKDSHETSASAHFVIGYDGEIIQCLPLDEIGYAVKGRNYDSVSIECCYLDQTGAFTEETIDSLTRLTAWLMGEYNLSITDIKRHYDEGGKSCPKYYVENEKEWTNLLRRINTYWKKNREA